MVPTPPGECLTLRDPELAPCLLGYEVLSDIDAYWPNGVEKGRGEMVRGRLVRICRWWKGLRILYALSRRDLKTRGRKTVAGEDQ